MVWHLRNILNPKRTPKAFGGVGPPIGFIKVIDATIGTTSTVGGDFVMTVDDGWGPLEVVLDKDITFNLTPLVGGTIVDVTGVLVPTGAGTWQLKPRGSGDIFIK